MVDRTADVRLMQNMSFIPWITRADLLDWIGLMPRTEAMHKYDASTARGLLITHHTHVAGRSGSWSELEGCPIAGRFVTVARRFVTTEKSE